MSRSTVEGTRVPVATRYAMIAVTPDITAFAGRVIVKYPERFI